MVMPCPVNMPTAVTFPAHARIFHAAGEGSLPRGSTIGTVITEK
jgi:hypothetical protein